MRVIPAINCPDFICLKEKLGKGAEFSSWVQLDIADGKFTEHKTWNHPEEILNLKSSILNLNLEVHLMVEKPEEVIEDWIKAGAKRLIIHLEAIKNLELITNNLKTCELGLAINPETPVEKLESYLGPTTNNQQLVTKFVQILAVAPGKSGQGFDTRVLEKIKFLKKNHPDVIIEVDGGINLETAKLCKEAGADILAAATYIWGNPEPENAYKELANI